MESIQSPLSFTIRLPWVGKVMFQATLYLSLSIYFPQTWSEVKLIRGRPQPSIAAKPGLMIDYVDLYGSCHNATIKTKLGHMVCTVVDKQCHHFENKNEISTSDSESRTLLGRSWSLPSSHLVLTSAPLPCRSKVRTSTRTMHLVCFTTKDTMTMWHPQEEEKCVSVYWLFSHWPQLHHFLVLRPIYLNSAGGTPFPYLMARLSNKFAKTGFFTKFIFILGVS